MNISRTQTITVPVNSEFPNSLMDQYDNALDRLALILFKFQEWNDDLSLRIFEWGAEVLAIDMQQAVKIRNVVEKTKKKIEFLVKEILVNPLDLAPLVNPLVDRQWIWEKWMLEEYQALLSGSELVSPFDQQPIQAKVHEFAVEMLAWTKSLITPSSSVDKATRNFDMQTLSQALSTINISKMGTLAPLSNPSQLHPQIKKVKLMVYLTLAQKYLQIRSERQRTKKWQGASAQVEILKNEMKVWQQEHQLQTKKEFEALETAVHQEIKTTKRVHQVEVDILNTRLTNKESDLQNLKVEVENEKKENRLSKEEIRRLRLECDHLRQEINDLDDSGCTIL